MHQIWVKTSMSIIETLRHMELSLFSGEILTKLYTKTSNYEMQ